MITYFRRLFGQIFYYGIGDAVTKSIVVLILPIFTRYLTPADYGVAAILTVGTVLVSGVADLGLSVSTYRFYYEGKGKVKKALSTAMISQVLLTSVIAIVALLLAKNLSLLFFKTPDYHYILSLAFLSIPLNDISVTPLNYLKLEGRARTCTLFKAAKAITDVFLKVLFVIVFGRGLTGLFEAQLLNAALYAVFFAIYALKNIGFSYSFDFWKKMVIFGLPFAASTVFFWVLNWADRFILGRLTNMTEVGLYTLGYTLGMAIMLPVGAFQTAWPAFYMSVVEDPRAKQFFSLVLTYFSFTIGYFILFIAIFSRDYFNFLTPAEFQGAYIIVPLIVISYTFLGHYSIMITGTYLKKETRYIFLTELLTVIINIGLMFLLIPHFGRVGAALATAISYSLLLVFIYLFTFRIFPVRYEYKRLIQIFLVLALIFWVSQSIYAPNVPNLLLRFLLTLSYPVLLYALGFFETKELNLIKEFFSKRLKPKNA